LKEETIKEKQIYPKQIRKQIVIGLSRLSHWLMIWEVRMISHDRLKGHRIRILAKLTKRRKIKETRSQKLVLLLKEAKSCLKEASTYTMLLPSYKICIQNSTTTNKPPLLKNRAKIWSSVLFFLKKMTQRHKSLKRSRTVSKWVCKALKFSGKVTNRSSQE
jgi:hypothetical protein